MANNITRVDYEGLADAASAMDREADRIRQITQRVCRAAQPLRQGNWTGQGARAFYKEMDGSIVPALQRLEAGLRTAGTTARDLNKLFQVAEAEAAAYLKMTAEGGEGASYGTETPAMFSGGAAPSGGPGVSPGGQGACSAQGWMGRNLEFKGSGNFFEIARRSGRTTAGRNVDLGLRYGFQPVSKYGDARAEDGWSAVGGSAGVGVNLSLKDPLLGAYAEGYGFRAQGDTLLAGDEQLGMTAAGEVNVASAEAMIGYNPRQKTFGASIGGKLATVQGGVGANIAGVNVGVHAEVGLKAELGFKIGARTEIKLPFITFGFSFGKARK